MKLLRFLIRRQRGQVLLIMLAGIVSGVSSAGLLAVIHLTVSEAEPVNETPVLPLFIALALLVPASWVLSQHLLLRFGQKMIFDLRLELTRNILTTPLRRIEELGPPRLLATLTGDIVAIRNGFSQVPELLRSSAIVLGCLAYLGWLSLPLFVLLVAVMTVGIFTYRLPVVAGSRHFDTARQHQDRLFSHFRSLTEGIKELKLHRRRSHSFLDLVIGTGRSLFRHHLAAGTIFAAAAAWGQLLFFAVVGLVVFAAPAWLEVESASMIGYVLVLLYMMGPLRAVLDAMPALGQADVAIEKVRRLGLTLSEVSDEAPGQLWTPAAEHRSEEPSVPEGAAADWSELRLDRVCFHYQRDREEGSFVVGPLDLVFRPGELVFLTGGNGSGKTTFAKLITGLYAPDSGEIRLDGQRIDESNRADYRQNFSVTFSDAFLFDDLLGLQAPDLDRRADEYIACFNLSGKVHVKNGSWSTIDLSQGQRKRLALVTSYLEDRPVYLFDEWAADQDPGFREVFYRQLLPELRARGKLVLVISHDDRYYPLADRVVRFEDGAATVSEPPAQLRPEVAVGGVGTSPRYRGG